VENYAKKRGRTIMTEEKYSDFSTVEKIKNFLVPETFPEGPYGSPRGKDDPVQNKSTPWQKGQRHYSAFNYEYKSLHQDIPRRDPGAHPVHDDEEKSGSY
jgi:hypothetical protein